MDYKLIYDTFLEEFNGLLNYYKSKIDREKILEELNSYKLDLQNPLDVGLDVLNSEIVVLQGYRDRVGKIILLVYDLKEKIGEFSRKLKEFLILEGDAILLTDEVQNLKSAELRSAKVSVQLRQLKELKQEVDKYLSEIDAILTIAKEVKEDLKSKNENVSRQLSIVQLMWDIGLVDREILQSNFNSWNRKIKEFQEEKNKHRGGEEDKQELQELKIRMIK